MRTALQVLKWIAGGVAALILVVVLIVAARLSLLPRSVTPLSGEIAETGVTSQVQIVRDRNDVPHISAANELDVYYGLGFAHAQDRLWQMNFYRRLLQGRLAELAGGSALKADELARSLDLPGRAKASFDHLSPHTRAVLDAYAAGVNAWVAAHRTNLPPEFTILMTKFEPWKPEDSLTVLKFLAMGLSGNAIDEVERARLNALLGAAKAAELFQQTPNAPVALRDAMTVEHADLERDPFLEQLAAFQAASNDWVVSGRFTKSGKPLLANDPHLSFTAPGIWYLAHLAFPNGNVAGGTIAGVPAIVLGHNDHIAWGFTTTQADVEDLVFETIDPKDPGRYLTPHGSEPFLRRDETISVRFGKAVKLTVLETRHGPVLPPIFKSAAEIAPKGTVVAMAATPLARDDTTFDSGLDLQAAVSAAAFEADLKIYQAPLQNMVVADTDGHIGFIVPGYVPVRSATATKDGLTPADGKLQDPLWQGFVPFAEMPQTLDPPAGKIWTANNQIVPDSYPHMITAIWPSAYRAKRIGELLSKGAPWGVDDFIRMQMDTRTDDAELLLPRLLAGLPAAARATDAGKRMAAWDQTMAAGRPEPAIYVSWLVHLQHLLLDDDLGKLAPDFHGLHEDFLLYALSPNTRTNWCDDVRTPKVETCDEMISHAFAAALTELGARYGSRPMSAWRWDEQHFAHHTHGVFGAIPVLSKFFNRSVPTPGGANTLNRGDMAYGGPHPYASVHGAGLRAVYDLSDLAKSRFMTALGQSGNPLSPYYDQFLKAAARGDTIEIPVDKAVYAKNQLGTWTITPVDLSELARKANQYVH